MTRASGFPQTFWSQNGHVNFVFDFAFALSLAGGGADWRLSFQPVAASAVNALAN
jgi:hypothetical protein